MLIKTIRLTHDITGIEDDKIYGFGKLKYD